MFAPIPVIHETHWYVNPLCPFFSFAQWTLWRTVMIHRLFFHSFYWIKTDRRRQCFSFEYSFFRSSLFPITCSNFRVDETFQASAQTLFDIRLRPNSLKFSASRFLRYPNIRTFKSLCSGTDIKQTSKTISFVLGRNVSQHRTSCMLLCIILLLHAFLKFQWISGFFVHTVVHQSTVRSVACNKLEFQEEVVTYSEMLPVHFSMKFWMTALQHHILTRGFANWKRLCQSMDGVYSCYDRTDSEGISDFVAVEITEISQTKCRYDFRPSIWTLKRKLKDIKH
jgi:major membrane immunogen (membrane-anchored lipoprotein)